MFEVTHMLAHRQFKKRIFPLVLPDAKIHTPKGRSSYLEYWDKKIKEQEQIINSLDNKAYAKPEYDELDLYSDIRRIVSTFNKVVGDMNTMSYNHHKANDYKDIVKELEQRILKDSGIGNPEEAYAVLQLSPSASPSQVTRQYNKLSKENDRGMAKAVLPELKKAHVEASQKLNTAYDIVLPAAEKSFTQEKNRAKRLIRSKKYIQAKNLLQQLIRLEKQEAELQDLLLKCENALTLGTDEEERKVGEKVAKASKERGQAKKEASKTTKETSKRSKYTKSPNSKGEVVQSPKMRDKMQMQVKNRKELDRKKTLRRILIPGVFAVLAIVAGFSVKERILQMHVENVIQKARTHVKAGELSSAVRLLEDSSRDLVYEERLAQELEDFRVLKKKYDELLIKIRSYKKQKKWKLAERGMLRILQYTPADSFMYYQLRDVQKELRVNDFNFWLLTAEEAVKQGEPGLLKAKQALINAQETKVGKKIIDENLKKVDSLIDVAFNQHYSKLKVLAQDEANTSDAIDEAEQALKLKPDNAEVKTILAGLRKQQ